MVDKRSDSLPHHETRGKINMTELDTAQVPDKETNEDELIRSVQVFANLKDQALKWMTVGTVLGWVYGVASSSGERGASLIVLGGLTGASVGAVIGVINRLRNLDTDSK